MYVVGVPETKPNWQWAEWLPHCTVRGVGDDEADSAGQAKEFDQLCFSNDKMKVSEFWKRIKRELDSRQVRMRDTKASASGGKADVSLPFVLVVVDLLGEVPPNSPLKEVSAEAVVATIDQAARRWARPSFSWPKIRRSSSECVAMVEGGRRRQGGLPLHRGGAEHAAPHRRADVIDAADARQKFAAQIQGGWTCGAVLAPTCRAR